MVRRRMLKPSRHVYSTLLVPSNSVLPKHSSPTGRTGKYRIAPPRVRSPENCEKRQSSQGADRVNETMTKLSLYQAVCER